jgi:hypothetical protein
MVVNYVIKINVILIGGFEIIRWPSSFQINENVCAQGDAKQNATSYLILYFS